MGFVGEDARLFAIAAAVRNFLGPAPEQPGGAWRISDREEPAFCLALNRANVASGAVKVVAISVGGVDALRVAHPIPIPLPGRGCRPHRSADRAGMLRRKARVQRRVADRALFYRRERL